MRFNVVADWQTNAEETTPDVNPCLLNHEKGVGGWTGVECSLDEHERQERIDHLTYKQGDSKVLRQHTRKRTKRAVAKTADKMRGRGEA